MLVWFQDAPLQASSPYSASSLTNLIELTNAQVCRLRLQMRYRSRQVRLKEHVCDHHKRFHLSNGVSNPWLCLNHDEGL
jgi:hypothetical protein